jgi:hypothetical protein
LALLFSSGIGVKFAQSSSQWEAGTDTQTLLTNKKQGNLKLQAHTDNIIKPT